MLIGVLPGLGPAATMAILLPIAYNADDPVSAIIMLAGIYYGAQYGGTITSVLLRIPGEASSVVTVFDGFALAKQGKAGTALGIAAIGSFVGATVSIIGLTLLGPIVAGYALDFGPPEYAALALLGVLLVATVGNGNTVKALAAAARRPPAGHRRQRQLHQRRPLHLRQPPARRTASTSSSSRWASSASARSSTTSRSATASRTCRPRSPTSGPRARTSSRPSPAIGRGSVIGFFLGVLPGGGAVMASLAAYAAEKRVAKDPVPLRPRCDRGRRRPGVGQQRRRHLVVHPAADDRHPGQRLDGDALRARCSSSASRPARS